jgi:L-lactate utilization protein LutC
MTIARDAFLDRVRQAVQAGNRAGVAATLPLRDRIGYQGAGPDPAHRFADELRAAGGRPYVVLDAAAAVTTILDLVKAHTPGRVLLGQGRFLDSLNLAHHLHTLGIHFDQVKTLTATSSREALFAADLSISGVHALIAETGTVVIRTQPDEPRSLSLLAPIHIAVATDAQLVPDVFDLFDAARAEDKQRLPSCVALITGPSKTGDIELRLVTGVHGPGEWHVVLVGRSG